MRLTNIRFLLTASSVILLLIYIFCFHNKTVSSLRKSNMCKAKAKAEREVFNGVLQRKFKDEYDHLIEKLEIKSGDNVLRTSFLANDVSGFYDILIVGDSLVKEKNSISVTVYRNGKINIHTLDYLCK